MTSINLLSLSELTTHADRDKSVSETVHERFKNPWEETVSLQPTENLLSEVFNVLPDDPLVHLIKENPVEEITSADLFVGGSEEVVLHKQYTIKNSKAIKDNVGNRIRRHDDLWCEELLEFDTNPEAVFSAQGISLVSDGHPDKKVLMWDRVDLHPIYHKELDYYIKPVEFFLGGEMVVVPGQYHFEIVEMVVRNLNLLNKTVYKNQINIEWLLKQPFHTIHETYGYFFETILDLDKHLGVDSFEGRNV